MFVGDHAPTLPTAEGLVRAATGGAPWNLSGRLKTEKSTIEKLRRLRTRLSTMQDIVGLRVLVPSVTIQDWTLSELQGALRVRRIDDLRERPRFGYRAVHVIVDIGEIPVEIQVRTFLEHGWADYMERLADAVGRDIRYGAKPTDPNARSIYDAMLEESELSRERAISERGMVSSYRELVARTRELHAIKSSGNVHWEEVIPEELDFEQEERKLTEQFNHDFLSVIEQYQGEMVWLQDHARDLAEGRIPFEPGVEWP